MPEIPKGSWVCIGIDPGKSGGLVCLFGLGVSSLIPMPDSERDVWDWIDISANFSKSEKFAVIEKVSSSPQMGVVSAFTFGQGYGFLRGCLTAAAIPFEEVRPQVWQKELGLSPRKKSESQTQWKKRLRGFAQQLYPSLPIWNEPKSLERQLAICDALLIAHFCKMKHGGH